MTQIAIAQQIEAIKEVTREALKSQEAAMKFLVDAGIVKEQINSQQRPSAKNKK